MNNIKVAKNLPKSSPTAVDILYLIMFYIDGKVDKPSILNSTRENYVFQKYFHRDI